ncbi:stage II sporulation protein Q [Terribacillus halophilus]|uniref:Stage II sporulation protein Q n=1 Tax=Terribacillus halophilus TaxID=361279 RepID=A0A1G6ID35_9BACI|nr:peptidoglycan DD-metalloendopeptidase family protein [Terribacillus halophilus]SDC04449.1 stage II sporulation protein Q [Terribacillus halophilus]
MKEKNSVSKSKWKRLFRKKWFFPALYLGISALLLTAVLWYQSGTNEPEQAEEDKSIFDSLGFNGDEEATPVAEQDEVVKAPVAEDAEATVVTKFYDHKADSESQENALVLYDNKYYQSTGVDYAAADGGAFDVLAALSGTVTEVKEDALHGNVVQMEHSNGVTTYYASLEDVKVEVGQEVKQGDVLATAGQSLFAKDKATHLHFEVRNGDTAVNPESFFNQPVSKLKEAKAETEAVQEEAADTSKQKEQEETEAPAEDNADAGTAPKEEADDSEETPDASDEEKSPEQDEQPEDEATSSSSQAQT